MKYVGQGGGEAGSRGDRAKRKFAYLSPCGQPSG
jgi:hypothetical protein